MPLALEYLNTMGLTPGMLGLIGLGLGVLAIFFGLSGAFAGQMPPTRRMHAVPASRVYGIDFDLVRGEDNDPKGLLKAFVPSSRRERTTIANKLRRAGVQGKRAVLTFYAVRTVLGLILPILFVAVTALPPDVRANLRIERLAGTPSWGMLFQIVTLLVIVGFYGPSLWLRVRIAERRRAIRHSFPNALDLLQVATEAGLGFDAAMVRVSHEMAGVAPAISQEFMMLQLEIQAGKERQSALLDMAERTGVEAVSAFANVILQANQFGTSVASALSTFATEMRMDRELRAQEKANRLPVLMSAVMALFMMPVLLMICLVPMLIRWINMFG